MDIRYDISKRIKECGNDIFIEIDGRKMTFSEFERKSNRISAYLKQINSKNPVLIIGHKNEEMLMLFYACFSMGIAYAPIDSATPLERIKSIYREMKPSVTFVCEKNLSFGIENELSFDMLTMICDKETMNVIQSTIPVKDTAYIMFTSGTTGKPKGILVSYEALFSFIEWIDNILAGKRFTIINQSLFSFDISIFDFYYSLFRACKMICITRNNRYKLVDCIQNERDVLLFSTPSYIKKVLYENIRQRINTQSVKAILVGGDYFDIDLGKKLKSFFSEASIYNLYGPTEATVVVSSVMVKDEILLEGRKEIPIGYIGNNICVVDEKGNELEEGEIGEIIIRGNQLANGYLGDDEQTQEKFKVNLRNERYYLTGDLGECKNGEIFFRGRKDMQCKINGYRIELLDVENNIRAISGIKDVLCTIKKIEDSIYLQAYIILDECDIKDEQDIRLDLKRRIPSYMIPKKICIVDSFPLTFNGKIDRSSMNG